jgi:rarD protein
MPHSRTARGTALSLFASCLFGLLYYYATVLRPLSGLEIFGWRILFTLPFLTLFIVLTGYRPLISGMFARLRTETYLLPGLLLSSFLIGVQFWLFLWAPINGKALDVSLGYLLMPLCMVICGRFVYKEQLRRLQAVAVVFAAAGVANQVWYVGRLSWELLLVAIGFPIYFMLRRKLKTDHLGGLWFDMLLMVPAACGVILYYSDPLDLLAAHQRLLALIPVLGLLSASATALYIIASRLLPFILFGLLSYAEPVLLVVVSLLLGESIRTGEIPTYLGVGLAICLLALDGINIKRTTSYLHPRSDHDQDCI